jgi:hypothetical protein
MFIFSPDRLERRYSVYVKAGSSRYRHDTYPFALCDHRDPAGTDVAFKDGMADVAEPIAAFLIGAGVATRDHSRWAGRLVAEGVRQTRRAK